MNAREPTETPDSIQQRQASPDAWANAGVGRTLGGGSVTTPSSHVWVILQVLLIIVAVALALWALHRLGAVLLMLIMAALFAYVIAPLVQVAEHPIRIAGRPRRLSRGPAIALVYLFIIGSVFAGAELLLPSAVAQFNDAIARAPAYTQSVVAWEHGWSRNYERLRIPLELRRTIDESVLAIGKATISSIRGSLLAFVGALSYVPWLVLIPILAFFLLKDAATFRRTIVKALPRHERLYGHRLFQELNATVAAYIRAQLLACVLVGSLCGVGFALLGVPYPALLGVLAGALEFIPLVGPLLLAIIAAIVAALHAPMLALWAVVFLGVLRLVEDYLIYPRLVRRAIHLHPLAIILGVLAGAELDGVAGMFLAVPTVAIASVVYRHWLEWRGADGMIGEAERVASPHSAVDVVGADSRCLETTGSP
jgi:predicted PurR-regulated permease PerM